VDVSDGHEWMSFGTDNEDGYYPGFVYNYNEKPQQG